MRNFFSIDHKNYTIKFRVLPPLSCKAYGGVVFGRGDGENTIKGQQKTCLLLLQYSETNCCLLVEREITSFRLTSLVAGSC